MKNYIVYFRGASLFNATLEAFNHLTREEVLSRYEHTPKHLKPKVTKNLNRIQLIEWMGNHALTIATRDITGRRKQMADERKKPKSATEATVEDFILNNVDEILHTLSTDSTMNVEWVQRHLNLYNKNANTNIVWFFDWDKESMELAEEDEKNTDYLELKALREKIDSKIKWLEDNLDMDMEQI